MLEIRLFVASHVTAVPSGPESHTFTVISHCLPPSQDDVINREKVYFCLIQILTRKL